MKEVKAKKGIVSVIVGIVITVLLVVLGDKLVEIPDATDIIVNKNMSGNIEVYTDPSPKFQFFGKLTEYRKSSQYWFSKDNNEGGMGDDSFKVKFKDNGTGYVSGSARIDLPLDYEKMKALHERFGSMRGISNELIRPIIRKAVFASGSMMESKEAITEDRNAFVTAIEDQAINGVYKTYVEAKTVKDEFTDKEVTKYTVRPVLDKDSPNGIARMSESPLTKYGIRLKVNVSDVIASEKVQAQLDKQQSIRMEINEARANADKAKQARLTAELQGKAAAETAKWEEERVKIIAVTQAEKEKQVAEIMAKQKVAVAELAKQQAEVEATKNLEVAKINKAAAEQDAKAMLVKATAEADANKLKVKAGATPQEVLAADVQKNHDKWEGISKIKLPQTVMTGGNGSGDSFEGFFKLMMAEKLEAMNKKK